MTYRIREHGAQVWDECQECKCLEYKHIDATEQAVISIAWQQYQAAHHKLRKQYKQPGHNNANDAANIL